MRRPGSQRASLSSDCRAQSVSFLCRSPRARACRAEGANAVRSGSAHARPAHGTGVSSISENQRRPLALMKWLTAAQERWAARLDGLADDLAEERKARVLAE